MYVLHQLPQRILFNLSYIHALGVQGMVLWLCCWVWSVVEACRLLVMPVRRPRSCEVWQSGQKALQAMLLLYTSMQQDMAWLLGYDARATHEGCGHLVVFYAGPRVQGFWPSDGAGCCCWQNLCY